VLGEWFGRPVLLLASGRSGLHLLLREFGFNRNTNAVQLAPFHSRCVINALTHQAMPVQPPVEADALLLYHQFGFSQVSGSEGSARVVIEDLAHAFFTGAGSGERRWRADYAIFSLPKFFPLAGLAGGIIARTEEQAHALRALLDRFPRADAETRAWMRRVNRAALGVGEEVERDRRWVDSMYELLFVHPHPDPEALSGFPRSIGEIAEIGERRAEIELEFRGRFEGRAPTGLWPHTGPVLPYALPCFGARPDGVERLRDLGLDAAVYHLDVRRDMRDPNYLPALLTPAHHQVTDDLLEAAWDTLLAAV
jgi:hypothetical protein